MNATRSRLALLALLLAGCGVRESAAPARVTRPVLERAPRRDLVRPTPQRAAPRDPRLARNFYFIIDGSGSMAERTCAGNFPSKLEAAKWAVGKLLATLEADVNLGLTTFDGAGRRVRVRLGHAAHAAVLAGVTELTAGGGTPLGRALSDAIHALGPQKRLQQGYGEYHIVVVTDGQAEDAPVLARAVARARHDGFDLHAVGFCVEADSVLRSGSASYRSARDPKDLRAALVSAVAEADSFEAVSFEAP